MIDRTRQDGLRGVADRALLASSRWTLPMLLAFAFVAAMIVGVAGAPYLFKGATLESEIARQLRATTGLVLDSPGSGRFVLLPRPHVAMDALHVTDPTGTLTIDADALDGDVRLLPLIVGRVELLSATLTRPRLLIDLDGTPMRPDSLIGRAVRAEEPAKPDGSQRLGIVTLIDGSATIKSKAFPTAPPIEAMNVTLDWRDLESPATLTGSMLIRKTAADIAAWIAQPSSLMRGDHSGVAFHIHAAPIDLSANGDLVSAATTGFSGHLTGKAPSAAALVDLIGSDTALLAPFANITLDSDATVSIDPLNRTSIDLPNLTLHADGNEYEGTLAFQSGEHPSLSGTLATDQLMLEPFLAPVPAWTDANHGWSTRPILRKEPQLLNLDLRISATHMRLAPFTVDDAALAVMTRNRRTEVALVEGKAYGGTMKGRLSVGVSSDGVSLRGTGSLTDADASTLTWDGFGRQLAAGTLAASFNLESSGESPAALMRNALGWIKGRAADGELSGVDMGRGLRDVSSKAAEPLKTALHGGRTPFKSLSFGAQIIDGIATIDEGTIVGPEAAVTFGGDADLGARRLDMRAVATSPTATKAAPGQSLAIGLIGSFDNVLIVPVAAQAPTAPADKMPSAPKKTP